MKRDEISLASPIGPHSAARPPSRTMAIAALRALPPQISPKPVAFSLEPRAGTPGVRKVRSRTGMPMQRIRGGIFGALTWKFMPVSVMSVQGPYVIGQIVAGSSLCACGLSPMQPVPDEMMRDRERMRCEQAVGMLALVHQCKLVAV